MMVSYSCHVGSGDHSITNAGALKKVANHNLRKYEKEDKDIELLRGSENLYQDVKQAYEELFEAAVDEYNAKQKRKDRRIDDYFQHVSDSSKTHLATELIIQVGDREFWSSVWKENWRIVGELYENQLVALEELLPNFKICNAVIHYDEDSPHMQVVGVPIAEYSKGLAVRSAKSEVFTQDSLRDEIQTQLRAVAEQDMQRLFSLSFTEKQQGHKYLDVLEYKVQQEQEKLNQLVDKTNTAYQQYLANRIAMEEQEEQIRILNVEIDEKEGILRNRDVALREQEQLLLVNADEIQTMQQYRSTSKACFDKLDELRQLVLGQYSNNWWPFRNRKAERVLLEAVENVRDYVLTATAALAAFEYRAGVPHDERVSERIHEGLTKSVDLLIANADERSQNRSRRAKNKNEWER